MIIASLMRCAPLEDDRLRFCLSSSPPPLFVCPFGLLCNANALVVPALSRTQPPSGGRMSARLLVVCVQPSAPRVGLASDSLGYSRSRYAGVFAPHLLFFPGRRLSVRIVCCCCPTPRPTACMHACSFRRHAGLLVSCDATAGQVFWSFFFFRSEVGGRDVCRGPCVGCVVYGQTTEKETRGK